MLTYPNVIIRDTLIRDNAAHLRNATGVRSFKNVPGQYLATLLEPYITPDALLKDVYVPQLIRLVDAAIDEVKAASKTDIYDMHSYTAGSWSHPRLTYAKIDSPARMLRFYISKTQAVKTRVMENGNYGYINSSTDLKVRDQYAYAVRNAQNQFSDACARVEGLNKANDARLFWSNSSVDSLRNMSRLFFFDLASAPAIDDSWRFRRDVGDLWRTVTRPTRDLMKHINRVVPADVSVTA